MSGRWIFVNDGERERLEELADRAEIDIDRGDLVLFRSLANREGLSEEEIEVLLEALPSRLYPNEMPILAKLRNPGGQEK